MVLLIPDGHSGHRSSSRSIVFGAVVVALAQGSEGGSSRTRLRPFAPLTTRLIDPVMRKVAGRLPGFGILSHTGRISGRRYRTPIVTFRRGDDYVVALGSGSDADWVRNVVAAGGCELLTRGRTVPLADPRIWVDRTMQLLPLPLRWMGAAIGLTEFLSLSPISRPAAAATPPS
jgi:deazaflavin-dependent oxidoreductase (nitroreductase family)